MRSILVIFLLVFATSTEAQQFLRPTLGYTPMGLGGLNNLSFNRIPADKKWFWTSSVGLTTGMTFFNGGNMSYLSVPATLQLNRRLNQNLYAFGNVSVAPIYSNFNGAFMSADPNKFGGANSFMRPGQMGFYSRAEMGLFYTNDSRTFSISGSISVERGTNPMLPYYQMNQQRPHAVGNRQ